MDRRRESSRTRDVALHGRKDLLVDVGTYATGHSMTNVSEEGGRGHRRCHTDTSDVHLHDVQQRDDSLP